MTTAIRIPAILTDDQFEDMTRKGAFARVGRVELRGGVITPMSPVYLRHSTVLTLLIVSAHRAIQESGAGLCVNGEISIRCGGGFQPTADVVIWAPAAVPAFDGPIPKEAVRLVIEVADASLADDLGQKLVDYAEAGLAEYWVADVQARLIHRCREPQAGGYRVREAIRFGEPCAAATIPFSLDTTGL